MYPSVHRGSDFKIGSAPLIIASRCIATWRRNDPYRASVIAWPTYISRCTVLSFLGTAHSLDGRSYKRLGPSEG